MKTKRNSKISILLNRHEVQLLDHCSEKLGLTRHDFIRYALRNEFERLGLLRKVYADGFGLVGMVYDASDIDVTR